MENKKPCPVTRAGWVGLGKGATGSSSFRRFGKARGQQKAEVVGISLSTAQIIEELPRLSAAELMAVRRKLMELAVENEDIELCNTAALDGALLLDHMEEENVGG